MIEVIERNGYWFQTDNERPNLRFLGGGGGGKKVTPPPVPDPVPTPEEIDIQALDAGEKARKRATGRQSLILTDPLGTVGSVGTSDSKPKTSLLGLTT